jgi:hypothetical protein
MNSDELHENINNLLREADLTNVTDAELAWQAFFVTTLALDGFMSGYQTTDTLTADSPIQDALARSYVGLHWLTHPALAYGEEDKDTVPMFSDVLSGAICLAVRRHQYDPFNEEQIKSLVTSSIAAVSSLVTLLAVSGQDAMGVEKKKAVGKSIASGLSAALNRELAMYDKALGELN